MPAGDIPAVEAEIRSMTPAIHGHWLETTSEAVSDLVDELDEMEESERLPGPDRRAEVVAAIAALLLLMRNRVDRDPAPRLVRSVRASARRLIVAGARSTPGARFRLQANSPTMRRMVDNATADLIHSSRARMREGRMAERLDASLTDFLTREEARRKRKPRDKLKPRKRRDGRRAAESRADWLRDLEGILSRRRGGTKVEVDRWAYATYNVGAFAAYRSRRVRALYAVNNPPTGPDDRTTPFCRTIHGRIISVERTERKLREYYQAVQDDDEVRARQLWPLAGVGLRRGATLNQIRGLFSRGIGIPPYHWGCRTQVRARELTT